METDADQKTTEGATAGSPLPNPEEKLLPPGNPTPIVSVMPGVATLRAADMLHGGNAVEAAQSAAVETPLERNLREVGLKEALPHQSAAPQRVSPEEKDLVADDGIPKIRTYAADMGEEMKKRGSTLSTIIGAEKAQVVKTEAVLPVPGRRRGHMILVIGAILFVMVGIGTVVTVLFLKNNSPRTPAPATTFISVNQRASVSREDKKPLSQTLAGMKESAKLNLGEIEAIDVLQDGAPMSVGDILTALGAPNELARNATSALVGIHAFNYAQPFIIVSVSAYDFSFRAMLAWEQTIGESLGNFFAPHGVAPDNITTRPPALTFSDTVSANLDVRESQSAWPIVYTFPRQNLLVITTNESTLREILTRLSLQNTSHQ